MVRVIEKRDARSYSNTEHIISCIKWRVTSQNGEVQK